ncbi:cytochrome P450 CYP5202A1 [Xylariales sp. PMI_506]|nr:cytochrome P450 CYP5202A1 [Xylariales sp. PMI_506]
MLPSSWKYPLGADILMKTLRAEKQGKLTALSQKDHDLYGDTYGQYAGGLFCIFTRDPRNIASVVSEQSTKFGYGLVRSLCFGPLLGHGIFTLDGPAWVSSRRLLATPLHKPQLLSLHLLEDHFQDLRRTIVSKLEATSTSAIDLKPFFFNYILDISTDVFLGNSTNLLNNRPGKHNESTRFASAFSDALAWISTRDKFKMFAWLVVTPGLVKSCHAARDSLKNMIIEAQRLELGLGEKPLTEFVDKAQGLERARDELITLFFAARDSNASLLCWMLYTLSREPEIFGKLEAEVLSTLGDDPAVTPTESDLAGMHYLDNIVREALRFLSPLPINSRVCSETTTLPVGGGASGEEPIFVPKGTFVALSTYACHRSTKYYGEDANKFRPERWDEVDVKTRTRNYTFIPFMGGPRRCPGDKFAAKLVKYTMCRLIQYFSGFTVDDPHFKVGSDWQEDVKCQVGISMVPDDGVTVNIAPRP